MNQSLKNLMVVSVSVLAITASVSHADNSPENDGVWNRFSKAVHSVADSVAAKGTAAVKNKAEMFINDKASEIGDSAAKQFNALMYRHADVQVVDDQGNHLGYVADINSQVVRNMVKKILGVDLNNDIPGVPSFLAKNVNNVIEGQIASYLEKNVQSSVKKVLSALTMNAIQKGLGLAEQNLQDVFAGNSAALNVQSKEEIKTALKNDKQVSDTELTVMSELIMAVQANFKSQLVDWLNQAANQVAEKYIKEAIDYTGENVLRGTEIATAAAGALVSGVVAGPLGAYATGGIIGGDAYLAEGAKQDSYFRQFTKWVTGFDARKANIEEKVSQGTKNQINARLEDALKTAGLGALVLNDQERELVYGKFESQEEKEFGFTNLVQVKKAYSFDTFKNRLVDAVKNKVVEVVQDTYSAADDVFAAMGPGLLYEDESDNQIAETSQVKSQNDEQEAMFEAYGGQPSDRDSVSWFSQWWNS